MALAPFVTTLEGLAEPVAKEYVKNEKDGKFYLNVTPTEGFALENVKGLKDALSQERSRADTAEQKLTVFKDIDPAAARDALSKVDEMKNWTPEQKVREQIEAREAQLTTKYGNERKGLEEQIGVLKNQLQGMLVTNAATKAILDAEGVPDLLLPIVERQVRMRAMANGEYVVEIVDGKNNPRVSPRPGISEPMTIAELVAELKTSNTFARAFNGNGASGGGATGVAKSGAGASGGGAGNAGGGTKADPIRIPANDQKAINLNFEKIAKGEAVVVSAPQT